MIKVLKNKNNLYNDLNGVNSMSEDILSLIGLTTDDFARFRDLDLAPFDRLTKIKLFTDDNFADKDSTKDKNELVVLARIGGGNRISYEKTWSSLRSCPSYIRDYDCTFDETYAYIEFDLGDKFEQALNLNSKDNKDKDFEILVQGCIDKFKMLNGILGGSMSDETMREKATEMAIEIMEGKI